MRQAVLFNNMSIRCKSVKKKKLNPYAEQNDKGIGW